MRHCRRTSSDCYEADILVNGRMERLAVSSSRSALAGKIGGGRPATRPKSVHKDAIAFQMAVVIDAFEQDGFGPHRSHLPFKLHAAVPVVMYKS